MIKLFAGFLLLAVLLPTPVAQADPGCSSNPYTCNQPTPPWNGQLQPTWNLPGIYGGQTNDPIYCNPMSRQCGIYAPNPNS